MLNEHLRVSLIESGVNGGFLASDVNGRKTPRFSAGMFIKEAGPFVGHFERLPVNVIDEVVINKQLRDGVSDPNTRRYLDKGMLIAKAGYFAIGENSHGTLKIQAPTMHRGFIIKMGGPFVDEFGNCYGEIGAKGTGISSRSISSGENHSDKNHPAGFFGFVHASQDMLVSDRFASHGGRTARGVGILVLNHQQFRRWYEQISKKIVTPYNPQEALSIVEQNGDTAVIYVRLMVIARLNEGVINQNLYGIQRLSLQAMGILNAEMALQGEEHPLSQVRSVRDFLTGEATFDDKLSVYRCLIHNWNLGVFSVVSERFYNGDLAFIEKQQDRDLLGTWYDWETSIPGIPGYGRAMPGSYSEFSQKIKASFPSFASIIDSTYQCGRQRAMETARKQNHGNGSVVVPK